MTTTVLDTLCEDKGLKAVPKMVGERDQEHRTTEPYGSGVRVTKYRQYVWKVSLTYQRRRLTVDFYTGTGWTSDPRAADVVSCLISDAIIGEQTFEEFCDELGYDADSRSAEQTWKACRDMAPKIRRLLGDDFDTFAQADH